VTAYAGDGVPLPPGGTARLAFTAGHRGSNPLPVAFALSGTDCSAVVLGTCAGAVRGSTPGVADPGKDRDKANGKGKGSGQDNGGDGGEGDH
jgi:hypothetical protein